MSVMTACGSAHALGCRRDPLRDSQRRSGTPLPAAGFTYDGVAGCSGRCAHGALARNETTPGLRRHRRRTPLETLTRLFLLQAPVAARRRGGGAARLVDPLAASGLLDAASVGEVAARLDVRPYAAGRPSDLWVVSDLTPGLDGAPHRVGADHVLGISAGLHLAGPAHPPRAGRPRARPRHRLRRPGAAPGRATPTAVVATDVNPRALWMTRLNAGAQRVASSTCATARSSSRWPGETFDLIATNPPFVISPGDRGAAGLPRLRAARRPRGRARRPPRAGAPRPRAAGARCSPTGSIAARPCRGTSGSPAGSTGPATRSSCSARCSTPRRTSSCGSRTPGCTAARLPATATTPGWPGSRTRVSRRSGSAGSTCARPTRRCDAYRAPRLALRRRAADRARRSRDWALAVDRPRRRRCSRPRAWSSAPDVRQETVGAPGRGGPGDDRAAPAARPAACPQADTVEAALVGACDGDLTVGQILDALAQLLGRWTRRSTARDLPARRPRARRRGLPQARPLTPGVVLRSAVSNAGWYPDPSGQPGQFRYWDGSGWSAEAAAHPSGPPPGAHEAPTVFPSGQVRRRAGAADQRGAGLPTAGPSATVPRATAARRLRGRRLRRLPVRAAAAPAVQGWAGAPAGRRRSVRRLARPSASDRRRGAGDRGRRRHLLSWWQPPRRSTAPLAGDGGARRPRPRGAASETLTSPTAARPDRLACYRWHARAGGDGISGGVSPAAISVDQVMGYEPEIASPVRLRRRTARSTSPTV